MFLKHLVDRYNIYFAYGPSKISQSIHATAINCVIVSLVLLQMSFMSLSLLRVGLKDITIFSLAGFILTVACLFAHIFFNCCKGFSPISYTRVSSVEGVETNYAQRHLENVGYIILLGSENIMCTVCAYCNIVVIFFLKLLE